MKLKEYLKSKDMKQREFARLLGRHDEEISDWIRGRCPVPKRWCKAIVELTGGAVTYQDLRPDDWQNYW